MRASIVRQGLEPGIYFGLDESVYHSDPAISRGDIVKILDTPATYWNNSWMNPSRKETGTSDAMEYGKAFHCMLFEPKEFEKRYQVVPVDPWCEGKIKISYDNYFAIVESIKVLRKGKDSQLFLTGGLSEVTIVYDQDGVRYRTRHDYLTPVVTTDFKTARTLHEGHLKREFEERGLDVQNTLYLNSRRQFRAAYHSGKAHVYGHVDKAFFQKFLRSDMDDFIFIFQRKTTPYPFEALLPEEDTLDRGNAKIQKATWIYKKYMQQFGTNPWPVSEGKVRRFSMAYGIIDEN